MPKEKEVKGWLESVHLGYSNDVGLSVGFQGPAQRVQQFFLTGEDIRKMAAIIEAMKFYTDWHVIFTVELAQRRREEE